LAFREATTAAARPRPSESHSNSHQGFPECPNHSGRRRLRALRGSDRRFNPGCGCLQSAQPKVWFGLNSRILNSGHFSGTASVSSICIQHLYPASVSSICIQHLYPASVSSICI
ncbi:hypothetical protein LEMLEM_LOCUS27856, partial [Lemmus lemmus]